MAVTSDAGYGDLEGRSRQELEALAQSPTTEPAILGLLVAKDTGMTAWFAAGNPRLPESAAESVIAGDAESLIRAVRDNEGLPAPIRQSARLRLDSLGDEVSSPDLKRAALAPAGSVTLDDEDELLAVSECLRRGDFRAALRHAPPPVDPQSSTEALAYGFALAWQADHADDASGAETQAAMACLAEVRQGTDSPYVHLWAAVAEAVVAQRHLPSQFGGAFERFAHVSQRFDGAQNSEGASFAAAWMEELNREYWNLSWQLREPITAELALASGGSAAAELALRRSMESSRPEFAAGAANSLAFLVLIPEGRLDEAERFLLLCGGTSSELDIARGNLGIVAFHREEFDRARRLFDQQIATDVAQHAEEAYYYLGRIEQRRGNHRRAHEHFKQSLALLQELDQYQREYPAAAGLVESFLRSDERLPDEVGRVIEGAGVLIRAGGESRQYALHRLESCAGAGSVNALAALLWHRLALGEVAAAVASFDRYAPDLASEGVANDEQDPFGLHGLSSLAAVALTLNDEPDRARGHWVDAAARGSTVARIHRMATAEESTESLALAQVTRCLVEVSWIDHVPLSAGPIVDWGREIVRCVVSDPSWVDEDPFTPVVADLLILARRLGEPSLAVPVFQRCRPFIEGVWEHAGRDRDAVVMEKARRAYCEAGLCLALDGREEEALDVWGSLPARFHVEAIVGRALIAHRRGDLTAYRTAMSFVEVRRPVEYIRHLRGRLAEGPVLEAERLWLEEALAHVVLAAQAGLQAWGEALRRGA